MRTYTFTLPEKRGVCIYALVAFEVPREEFEEFLRRCRYNKMRIVYKINTIYFEKEEDRMLFMLSWL
jgi:hypothetical protein